MKSHFWLLTFVLSTSVWLNLSATAAPVSEPTVTLEIKSQPLRDALSEFGRQSGLQVVFIQTDVDAAIMSSALTGTYSAQAALERLLANTPLVYEFINERTVAVKAKGTMAGKATASGVYDGSTSGSMRLAQADASAANPSPSAPGQDEQAQQGAAGSGDSLEDVDLEEIVVTAQKRIERIQDVPVPVTAISGEALTNSNKLRIEDYYTKIPGVALRAGGNGGEPVVIIRGVATGGDTNPTVGTVVDEVSYGGSVITGLSVITAADIDPGDLARVEVLRGPQGTLYGASSIGGLLKFVTVDPSTERLTGRVQVGTTAVHRSSDVGYSVRGSVNVPLSDTFAVRASAFTLQDPGYVDNAETNERDVNHRDSDGGRLSALWRPSDAFSLKLSALIQQSERGGTSDVDTAQGQHNFRQSFLNGTGVYSKDAEAYSATMVGKLGAVELTSATGYSVDEQFDDIDTTLLWGPFPNDLFGVDRAATRTNQTIKKFSQELRALTPIGERLSWLIGAFYTEERTFLLADNQAADSTGEFVGSMLSNVYDPGKFEERAVFTNLTVGLTDRWDIQFGGRYSENQQNLQLILGGAFFGPDPILGDAIEAEDSAFTYLVTPRFKVSQDLMLYARLASGYRPGGPNAGCVLDAAVPCKFKADATRNYEIGIKGNTPGNGISYDASLYYIDWQDIQISGLAIGGISFTDNVSRAKSQGVELSAEARPLAGLKLSGWVAYNDAKLTDDFPPQSTLVGRSGDRLPYSSRFSGNVSLDQEFPLWGTASGSVGGSFSYVGDRKGSFQLLDARQTLGSYTQLDLHGAMRYGTWTFNAFVNNVTDERGELRGGLDAVFMPTYFTYIQPRTIGLSLSKSL